MTQREVREHLLGAFDHLDAITHGEKRATAAETRCAYCGESPFQPIHDQACAPARALAAIRFHVPSILERERWLAEPSTR